MELLLHLGIGARTADWNVLLPLVLGASRPLAGELASLVRTADLPRALEWLLSQWREPLDFGDSSCGVDDQENTKLWRYHRDVEQTVLLAVSASDWSPAPAPERREVLRQFRRSIRRVEAHNAQWDHEWELDSEDIAALKEREAELEALNRSIGD